MPTQFRQYGSVRGAAGNRRPYRDQSFDRETILAELEIQEHHITNTAKALERSHLYKKCQQLGINLRTLRTES